MRSVFLTALLLLPCQLIADSLISEHHAMFYYKVPLGGSKIKQDQHTFGFRMDRVSFNAGEMLDQQKLFHRPAMFDFKMNHQGVEGIYLSGNNFMDKYRVSHADEDGRERTAPPLTDIISDLPVGVFIGVGIGVVIVSGVGG